MEILFCQSNNFIYTLLMPCRIAASLLVERSIEKAYPYKNKENKNIGSER